MRDLFHSLLTVLPLVAALDMIDSGGWGSSRWHAQLRQLAAYAAVASAAALQAFQGVVHVRSFGRR